MIKLNEYAEAQLQVFNNASLKTDAGVQSVLTYLLAYPGQSVQDVANVTGFDEVRVGDYLSALGDLVESDGAMWRPSARARTEIEYALAISTGSAKSSSLTRAAALTAKEAERWEEIKRIIMDTTPEYLPGEKSLREQYTHYFSFVDSSPPKTLDEAISPCARGLPGETIASLTFSNQNNIGITVHRPGTQPAIDFGLLIKLFQENDDDCLHDSDGPLILKALALGLTFW
jgi:hypothetical protein